MHCLRHILLYAILIPMPAASPFFLLIFTIAAYWTIRPCGYCMTILAILFFSTSPSSPFLAVLSNTPAPPPKTSTPVAYDMNIPERGAFFLNGGYVFDPVLIGYREMQRVWRETLDGEQEMKDTNDATTGTITSESAVSSPAATAPAAAESPELELPSAVSPPGQAVSPGLPAGYVDLRIGGVGLVLDLGWHRTDEALRWEAANVLEAAEAKRRRRARWGGGGSASASGSNTNEGSKDSPGPQVHAHAQAVTGAGSAGADGGDGVWMRSPFVGFW